MKKMLLMAAAVMMGTAAFAEAVKTDVTSACKITEVEGTNDFAPNADFYYVIYCGEETMGELGIDASNSLNFLANTEARFDIWPGGESVAFVTPTELNSFGIAAEYQNPTVADWGQGWYGGGWAAAVDDVTSMPADATFHMAVSSMKAGKHQINLPNGDYEANIVLDFGGALKADGTWYNVEISLADLKDASNVDYKNFAGGYVASFNQAADVVPGDGFSWDHILFYGSAPEKGGEEVDAIQSVKAETNVNAPIYNLAGQRVAKNYKGLAIQNGKKFIVK